MLGVSSIGSGIFALVLAKLSRRKCFLRFSAAIPGLAGATYGKGNIGLDGLGRKKVVKIGDTMVLPEISRA